jgi:glycosidase
MKSTTHYLLTAFIALLFADPAAAISVLKISPNSTDRATSEVEANYTTTHLYINEVAGESIPITIFFDPGTTGVEFAEVFTNLNRRDRADDDANSDGIEDGILPPNGNDIAAGNDANYFKAHTMQLVSGGYQITLFANKTGAYRLTARYRLNGESAGTYTYYNNTDGGGKRDHAIVVSPKSARNIQLYEVNPLTVIATGTLPSQRGTFADLAGGVSGGPRFNLDYVKGLGCNMLWFQPIHPNGIDGRQIDPDTGQPFEVGSPYAVKNFFEVMPLMAKSFTAGNSPATNDTPAGRAQALAEFKSFSEAADTSEVGLMLDAPFNHTSYDTELAALGQTLFGNGGTNANSEMRNTEARFFSRRDAYDMRASSAGNIGLAPDRSDFGKFADTYDVFYGRYAALVSGSTGGYQSEADWFDYSVGNENTAGDGHFDGITRNVWKYFAEYTLHWLTQTGYPANPTGDAIDSDVGVDALRADFGQGLPPQAWEYIINKTRARKWNFVFMAESLDGGAVTYRSGRHFDILNENIVFPLHAAQNTTDFRSIYESRRNAYGQALVLLNTSSHDEDHYQDPWHALIRFAANSSIDGVPLIFPGQELGLSGAVVPPGDTQSGITPFGYDRYETNFGKPIPHFKKYNSLMPLWLMTTPSDPSYSYGISQLAKVYEGIGQARQFSSALRGSNRHFLNLKDNTPHSQIFSVAKFENRNAAPNLSDVVLAFVNLDRNANPATIGTNKFNINIDADTNGNNDFGIKPDRTYNVKNIAAYLGADPDRRNTFLIPGGISGDDLLSQGLFVNLNRVPTTDGEWATAPYEAQYLKLYDVTSPPAPAIPVPDLALFGTVIGNQVTFQWSAASDPEGGVSGYHLQVGTTPGGNDLFDSQTATTSQTVTVLFGTTVHAQARQINNAGIAGSYSVASDAVLALDPAADQDADGQSNGSEHTAGTNPLSSGSVLRITATSISGNEIHITAATVAGRRYQCETSAILTETSWETVGDAVTATGLSTLFTAPVSAGQPKRFFRIRVVP